MLTGRFDVLELILSGDNEASLRARFEEHHGGHAVMVHAGIVDVDVECPAGRASAVFAAGSAAVTASAFAYDAIEGTYIYRNAAATIGLRAAQ